VRDTELAWRFNNVPSVKQAPGSTDRQNTLITATHDSDEVRTTLIADIEPASADVLSKIAWVVKNGTSVEEKGTFASSVPSSYGEPGRSLPITFDTSASLIWRYKEYTVEVGLDTDGDEIPDECIDSEFKIIAINSWGYWDAKTILDGVTGVLIGGPTDTIVKLFKGATPSSVPLPPTSSANNGTVTTSENRLTHNTGAFFSGAGLVGTDNNVPTHTWDKDTDMAEEVEDSDALEDAVTETANDSTHVAQVVTYFASNNGSHEFGPWGLPAAMEFDGNPILDLREYDLEVAFHGVNLSGSVYITYEEQADGSIKPISAHTSGTSIEDLIDYRFLDDDGSNSIEPVHSAAICQIGFSRVTGRNAGAIFLVEIEVEKTYTNPTFLPVITP